jgi:hypothetical protein
MMLLTNRDKKESSYDKEFRKLVMEIFPNDWKILFTIQKKG